MLPDARAEAAGPHGPPGLELLTTLARAILALVGADTDDAVLRAVASVASAYGPSLIRLYTLRDDPALAASGEASPGEPGAVPTHAELSSVWQGGVCPAEDPLLGRPFALADHPVLARWLAAPTRPLVLHDLSADPRAGAQPHERSAQALVVLPLRVGEPARWPGLLVLSWKIVHIPGPRERLAYGLLARVVASLLADRDALRAHQRALDEANAVHVVALALADATGRDDILAALAEPAQAIDASSAALWLGDLDRPELLVLAASAGDPAHEPAGDGAPAPVRPLAEVAGLLARPNEPWLFEQVRSDSSSAASVDAAAPPGTTVMLPLAWNGHEAAVVELAWSSPRPVPAGLRRLYTAVAGQAAIALSGDLLLAAAARAGGAFDLVPAGVLVVDGGTGAVTAGNAAGEAVLARGRDVVEQALRGPGGPARLDLELGPQTVALFIGDDARDGAPRRLAVVLDTTAQTWAERERLRAREGLLHTQTTLLARRAVPAIAVADTVFVVPVVGGLDDDRAQQLADVLAAVPSAPRTVILDFTGVTAVEPDAAPVVRDAARALAGRGVAVTLTGVPAGLDDGLELERAGTLGEAIAAALVAVALT